MRLKSYIRGELNKIPDFIDTKNSNHKDVWDMMTLINETILELISLKSMKEAKIMGIVNRFNDYMDYSMEIIDTNIILSFTIYYTAILEWIMDEAVKLEEYETAHNVKLFNDLYFKLIEQ
jgi:hypothetical protein